MLKRYQEFIDKGLWEIESKELSKIKALGLRTLRIIVLTIKGFTKSQIQQGASYLTYYSLLGIVPIIALFFGIARGFLLEGDLKNLLLTKFKVQEAVIIQLINFAEASLEMLNRGVIAGAGILILLWSVVKILRNIEIVMNETWEVTEHRTIAKQFSDYLALMFICPVLLIASSGLSLFISARLSALRGDGHLFAELSPVLFYMINIVTLIIPCALFTFLYIFIPNTQVRFRAACYAGLIAGGIYQVIQWAYIYFQIGVSSYNAIYGTFAAFPLFLIWLHLSWVILLLGAKIAFAFQNVDAYEFITEEFDLSLVFRKILSLRITHLVIQRFIKNRAPPKKKEISNLLSIPLVLTSKLLTELVKGKILIEVKQEDEIENAYQPAVPVDQLTIKRVIDMIERRGDVIPLPPSKELNAILKSLEHFSSLLDRSDANILLKNIK